MNKFLKSSSLNKQSWYLLLAHLIVWTLACWLLLPGMDRFADSHELYAWGIVPQWGTFKHPPLLSWFVGFWFQIFPTKDWAFHLLSVLNSTISIYFIARLTKELFSFREDCEHLAFLAIAFCTLSLTYGNLALKLNMNTVLLPLWPLVCWCFVLCIKRKTIVSALLLGVVGAACMLGKYYSGIILLSLFISSLCFSQGRHWFKSAAPYIALVSFILCLLPHLNWVVNHNFITFKYVEEQAEEVFEYWRIFSFVFMVFATSFISIVLLYFAGRPWRLIKNNVNQWKIVTVFMFVLPIVITLIIGWTMSIELSSPWALPLSFLLPALFLFYFQPQSSQQFQLNFIKKSLIGYWVVALAIGVINSFLLSKNGADYYYLPRQELSLIIENQHQLPQWVAGDWQYSTALSFYQNEFIVAIPDLPAKGSAVVHTPANWQQQRGLIIYPAKYQSAIKQAQIWLKDHELNTCIQKLQVARQGWRFLQHKPVDFVLIWAYPQQQVVDCAIFNNS